MGYNVVKRTLTGQDEQCRDAGMSAAVFGGLFRVENEKRGRKGIGQRGGRGNDRRQEKAFGGFARTRVDDVAVAFAMVDEKLMLRAGSAEGFRAAGAIHAGKPHLGDTTARASGARTWSNRV